MSYIIPPDDTQQYDQFGQPIRLAPQIMPVQDIPIQNTPQQNNIPAPTAATIQPDFSPLAPMPAQSKLESLQQPPNPNDPQYQYHGLRRILNGIAGGFAGAAGHPEIGSELADAKYIQALQYHKNQLETLKPQVESESERERLGSSRGVAQSNAQYKSAEQIRKEAEDKEKERVNKEKEDVAKKELERKQSRTKVLNEFDAFKQTPEGRRAGSDLQYIMRLPPDEQLHALDILKEKEANKQKDLERIQAEAKAKALGAAEVSTSAPVIDAAKKKSEATTLGRLDAEGSDTGIHTARSLAEARSLGNILTSNIKDTRAAANAGLEHLPRIFKQIDEMDAAGKLGPIMSKWSDFMAGKVGTDAEAAALRFNIGLMDTLLAKTHGGARGGGSPKMMEHFQSLLSSKNMSAKTLKFVLNETKDWLTTYSKSGEISPINDTPKKSGIDFSRIIIN